MKAIYTTTSLSHLYKVKTFTESFAPLHPDVRIYVVMVEELEAEIRAVAQRLIPEATFLYLSHLDSDERATIRPDYNFFEACCAYRPFFAELLFSPAYDISQLVYMDSDLLQYASIEGAFAKLTDYSLLLTPHNTEPAPLSEVEQEQGMLRCGIYNAGFIGMRRSAETTRFLDWWKERMRQLCIADASRGLFVDQIWLNLAAVYFDGVYVEKDPGYNAAYWNFFQRRISRNNGELTANGSPLRFIHYSGILEEDPVNITRHMPALRLEEGTVLKELFDDYRVRLARNTELFLPLQPPPPPPPPPPPTFWEKVKIKVGLQRPQQQS